MTIVKVKNTARRVLYLDGGAVLDAGDTGSVQDSEHTRALIDAGQLLDLKTAAKAAKEEDA